MTVTLELEPAMESRLRETAARAGLPVEEYLYSLVAKEIPEEPMPRTGAEALAYWRRHDCLGGFADGPDSPELARQWREQEQHHRDDMLVPPIAQGDNGEPRQGEPAGSGLNAA